MDFSDTLDQLNITLGDSSNVTFAIEEKQRALQKAWNDSHVVDLSWDTSLIFDTQTYRYTVPTTLTTVKDIYISPSNSTSDEPEKIDSRLWEVVDGTIQFKNSANNVIPDGYRLYVKGNKKLDYNTDTITATNLQEYVIALGGYNTLAQLGYKKANLFLKNDTSMGELVTLKRDLKQDVTELKAKLPRSFESV